MSLALSAADRRDPRDYRAKPRLCPLTVYIISLSRVRPRCWYRRHRGLRRPRAWGGYLRAPLRSKSRYRRSTLFAPARFARKRGDREPGHRHERGTGPSAGVSHRAIAEVGAGTCRDGSFRRRQGEPVSSFAASTWIMARISRPTSTTCRSTNRPMRMVRAISDVHFLMPELTTGLDYTKGPFYGGDR